MPVHPAWSMVEPLANVAKDLIARFMSSRAASAPKAEDPGARLSALESRISIVEEHEQAQGALVHKLAQRVDVLTRSEATLRKLIIYLLVLAAFSFGFSLYALLVSGR
jgi:hypothetical protein